MPNSLKKPLSLALGALATATLGGCYYDGDLYGPSYASAGVCANDYYDYDPYAYSDCYGYDCYDPTDYSGGFVQIGFGGGWYDNYYYPGYGMWMFDNYRNRYPLRDQYLNYWGGRRAWWKHRGDRGDGHWQGRPPSSGGDHGGRPHRPGGWQGHDRDGDGQHGTRPPGGRPGAGTPPTSGNPGRPDRGPGVIRPRPPVGSPPTTEPGDQFTVPRRPAGGPGVIRTRPAPTGEWTGSRQRSSPVVTAPPANRTTPAPQRPSPALRTPPPRPPAVSAPPPTRPTGDAPRRSRGDRSGHVREN